jgi:hypothetical protein
MIIREPGVLVSDWDGKELEETLGGLRSNIGNDRGNLERFGFGDGQSRSFHTIWGNVCAIAKCQNKKQTNKQKKWSEMSRPFASYQDFSDGLEGEKSLLFRSLRRARI